MNFRRHTEEGWVQFSDIYSLQLQIYMVEEVYGRNVQVSSVYVAPHNIECYKCHNYGHIAQNCKRVIEPSMKENNDNRNKKVWKRKERQEEHMNEERGLRDW
jgi:hypothetical protein